METNSFTTGFIIIITIMVKYRHLLRFKIPIFFRFVMFENIFRLHFRPIHDLGTEEGDTCGSTDGQFLSIGPCSKNSNRGFICMKNFGTEIYSKRKAIHSVGI